MMNGDGMKIKDLSYLIFFKIPLRLIVYFLLLSVIVVSLIFIMSNSLNVGLDRTNSPYNKSGYIFWFTNDFCHQFVYKGIKCLSYDTDDKGQIILTNYDLRFYGRKYCGKHYIPSLCVNFNNLLGNQNWFNYPYKDKKTSIILNESSKESLINDFKKSLEWLKISHEKNISVKNKVINENSKYKIEFDYFRSKNFIEGGETPEFSVKILGFYEIRYSLENTKYGIKKIKPSIIKYYENLINYLETGYGYGILKQKSYFEKKEEKDKQKMINKELIENNKKNIEKYLK